MPPCGGTGPSQRTPRHASGGYEAVASEVIQVSERDPEWEPVFGTPQAVANPGGMIQPDTDGTTGDERLDQLPDFENDELRGASQQGAGVLSQGGTATETGQASGMDRP